jgi:hypothetical protein
LDRQFFFRSVMTSYAFNPNATAWSHLPWQVGLRVCLRRKASAHAQFDQLDSQEIQQGAEQAG